MVELIGVLSIFAASVYMTLQLSNPVMIIAVWAGWKLTQELVALIRLTLLNYTEE